MSSAVHPGPTSPLLTVQETARTLRVSERTVRRLIGAGLLPALRISSRTVRVDPGELHAWLYEDAGASAAAVPAQPRTERRAAPVDPATRGAAAPGQEKA